MRVSNSFPNAHPVFVELSAKKKMPEITSPNGRRVDHQARRARQSQPVFKSPGERRGRLGLCFGSLQFAPPRSVARLVEGMPDPRRGPMSSGNALHLLAWVLCLLDSCAWPVLLACSKDLLSSRRFLPPHKLNDTSNRASVCCCRSLLRSAVCGLRSAWR